jgi:2'-5' RNA ligase
MSQKYLVAHFFESQAPGFNFSGSEWPLHVTFLPIFKMEWSLEKLIHKLEKLALKTPPFDITSDGRALFGVNQDIPVTLFQPNNNATNLHYKFMAMSGDNSFTYNFLQFNGKGFTLHATVQNDNKIQSGQTYRVGDITIVDMYPDNDINRRAIIDTFLLRGE